MMYQNNCAEYNPDHVTSLQITDLAVHNGTDNIYCFVQPRTCNYDNPCSAHFPEGIIINYEERKIISLI
jgi:hypothetical protein